MRRFEWTPEGWRRVRPAEPREGSGSGDGANPGSGLSFDFGMGGSGMSDESGESSSEIILEYLREEGYLPKLDEDGDIVFKCEGRTYYVILDGNDEQFFRLVFPNFWSISDEEERARVMSAAQAATAKTKVAKIFPVKDDTWASVELFLPSAEAFNAVFSRSMSALRAAVQTFREVISE
jgi:hypothetical protein